jgi:hypothetical protein
LCVCVCERTSTCPVAAMEHDADSQSGGVDSAGCSRRLDAQAATTVRCQRVTARAGLRHTSCVAARPRSGQPRQRQRPPHWQPRRHALPLPLRQWQHAGPRSAGASRPERRPARRPGSDLPPDWSEPRRRWGALTVNLQRRHSNRRRKLDGHHSDHQLMARQRSACSDCGRVLFTPTMHSWSASSCVCR